MFNWTYAILFTLAGYIAAGSGMPAIKGYAGTPKWMWILQPIAPILNIGLLGVCIFMGFKFGVFWGFVSFGEAMFGAFICRALLK